MLMPSQHVALERKDYSSFVTFFRQASPYIEGHRGRTFVVVVPGEVRCHVLLRRRRYTVVKQVVDHKDMLTGLLEDISLLHGTLHSNAFCKHPQRTCPTGLGVRLVLVVGARTQINRALLESGHLPQYTDGMRVTDADALQVAIEAAGSTRMEIEARLSRVRVDSLCVCVVPPQP